MINSFRIAISNSGNKLKRGLIEFSTYSNLPRLYKAFQTQLMLEVTCIDISYM